jgi:hypothetical protein
MSFCVCSGLETVLITHSRSHTSSLYDPQFQINSKGKQTRGLIPNAEEKEVRIALNDRIIVEE